MHLSKVCFSTPIILKHEICYLNVSGLLILQEVSDKQAFPFALHKMIMTLSWACRSAACRTHCTRFLPDQRPSTRALGLFKTEQRSIARIEIFILLIPGSLHCVEYVEAPVYSVMYFDMLVGTDVAHARLTCHTILQSLHIWVFLLFVDLAVRDVRSHWLDEGVVWYLRLMCGMTVVVCGVGASVRVVWMGGLR